MVRIELVRAPPLDPLGVLSMIGIGERVDELDLLLRRPAIVARAEANGVERDAAGIDGCRLSRARCFARRLFHPAG